MKTNCIEILLSKIQYMYVHFSYKFIHRQLSNVVRNNKQNTCCNPDNFMSVTLRCEHLIPFILHTLKIGDHLT